MQRSSSHARLRTWRRAIGAFNRTFDGVFDGTLNGTLDDNFDQAFDGTLDGLYRYTSAPEVACLWHFEKKIAFDAAWMSSNLVGPRRATQPGHIYK